MATSKTLMANNTLGLGDYHFESLDDLADVFEDRMAEMQPQSEGLFRIFCDAACGNFVKSVGYVVHLFRGATTTYASGYCQSVGGLTYILIAKTSSGWSYYKMH